MSIFWEDLAFEGPGLHVLLIVVSNYPYAAAGELQAEETYGLGQLAAPARTVKDIADWLIKHARDLALPLRSIRLLASPSPLEISNNESLKNLVPATLQNVQAAMISWRKEASRSPDNATLFYFAGRCDKHR